MPTIDLALLDPAVFESKEARDAGSAQLLARFVEEVFAVCYANRTMSTERVSTMRELLEKINTADSSSQIELSVREFEFIRGMLLDTPLPSGNYRMLEALYRMFAIGAG